MRLSDTAKRHVEAYGIDAEKTVEFGKSVATNAPVQKKVARSPVELLPPWNEFYYLHTGSIPVGSKDHPLVVLIEGTGGPIWGVHVVPVEIVTPAEEGRPIELLQKLASHGTYGLGVSFGSNEASMFYQETIKAPPEGKGAQPARPLPEGHVAAVQDTVRRTKEGLLQILLAFAVDATAVREGLGLG